MKFSFRSFVIGFGCAAFSLGAVTYANAAGDATLKACANKTSGAMRYISKGSCKKTEKLLSWSQMGPQGLTGALGPKGDVGAAGTNGSNGSNGINGQNIRVIDASGRDLGVALNPNATMTGIFYDGGIWTINNTSDPSFTFSGDMLESSYFSDSSCSTRLWQTPYQSNFINENTRGVRTSSGVTKYYKPTGTPYLGSSIVSYGRFGPVVNNVWTCIASTNQTYALNFQQLTFNYFTPVTEVTPPPFTAPFTLVIK